MELVIEPFDALPCELEVFTINGKKANSLDFGMTSDHKEDFENLKEYQEQNQEYTRVVNDWLIGKADDTAIMEFAWDSNEPIGIFNLISIIYYLKKKNVIA